MTVCQREKEREREREREREGGRENARLNERAHSCSEAFKVHRASAILTNKAILS